MARPPRPFHLKTQDKKELRQMLSGGIQQVRVVLRWLALLQLDAGLSAPKVSRTVPFAAQAIRTIGKRYQQGGLERALFEKKRTGHAELLEASNKQRIIAMVCSQPPHSHTGSIGVQLCRRASPPDFNLPRCISCCLIFFRGILGAILRGLPGLALACGGIGILGRTGGLLS